MQTPTFMAYKLRLLCHMSRFYWGWWLSSIYWTTFLVQCAVSNTIPIKNPHKKRKKTHTKSRQYRYSELFWHNNSKQTQFKEISPFRECINSKKHTHFQLKTLPTRQESTHSRQYRYSKLAGRWHTTCKDGLSALFQRQMLVGQLSIHVGGIYLFRHLWLGFFWMDNFVLHCQTWQLRFWQQFVQNQFSESCGSRFRKELRNLKLSGKEACSHAITCDWCHVCIQNIKCFVVSNVFWLGQRVQKSSLAKQHVKITNWSSSAENQSNCNTTSEPWPSMFAAVGTIVVWCGVTLHHVVNTTPSHNLKHNSWQLRWFRSRGIAIWLCLQSQGGNDFPNACWTPTQLGAKIRTHVKWNAFDELAVLSVFMPMLCPLHGLVAGHGQNKTPSWCKISENSWVIA